MKQFGGILFVLMALLVGAGAATLHIGDPAPDIKASRWIKGAAVEALAPDRTYVVEFWATWCPPCRTTIPHLTKLAKQYPDITFIGMSVWERGANPEEKVTQFVEAMGAQMEYTVAMDTADHFMGKTWMEAAGQGGIPAAFLVQNGTIVWIGHPMSGLDAMLAQAAAGPIDVEAIRKAEEQQRRLMATLDQYVEAISPNGSAERAQELAAKLEALNIADPDLLNKIAWFILAYPTIEIRDYALAERLAKKAIELADSPAADVLDTYARALYEQGELAEAIRVQRQAADSNPDDPEIAATLEKYLAEQPDAQP